MKRIKKKKRERERRLCVREREPRGRESEKGRRELLESSPKKKKIMPKIQ